MLLAAAALALAGATGAWAHGDPASHYLEAEQLYPAFADRPSQELELELLGHLQAAARRGYPIKVALVGTADDLTDNPELLRKPQQYAEFVASQLDLEAPVLVVTPYGFGVYGPELHGARAVLRGMELPPRAHGDALARTATVAVRKIAAAAGRPLPAHVAPAAMLRASGSTDTAPAGDDGGVNLWLVAGLFAVVFFPSVVLFEVWLRGSRRRRDRDAGVVAGP